MAEEIEKTCENCKYDYESMEGDHCRHCIHSAEENFEPKEIVLTEKEIRNEAITDFAERLKSYVDCGHLCSPTEIRWSDLDIVKMIDEIAEEMRCAE